MFAAKTARLIDVCRAHKHVLALKPAVDARYGGGSWLRSKGGAKYPAILIDHKDPMSALPLITRQTKIEMVAIDEASFFPVELFIELLAALTQREFPVYIAGLAYYASRAPWGVIPELMKIDGVSVEMLTAQCDYNARSCGIPAIHSYQKMPIPDFSVGSEKIYGACCDDHYSHLHRGETYNT